MVRSVRIAAVVVGLAWTSLAGAQSSPTATAPRERYLTVREEGKPPVRCKLLRVWKQPNGVPTFQVQALGTGEIMTIVGSGPPSATGDPRALSTRIYHWTSPNQPPPGAPQPPPTASALIAHPRPPSLPQPVPFTQPQLGIVRNLAATPQPGVNSNMTTPPQSRIATNVITAPQPRTTSNVITAPQPRVASTVAAAPQPTNTNNLTAAARPVQAQLTARKPAALAAPIVTQPAPQPSARVAAAPVAPRTIPVPQPMPACPPVCNCTPAAPPQPRLVPTCNTLANKPNSCDCCCPPCNVCPPCNNCCQSCPPCGQSSCICCTPSPMRQTFISRLLKPRCSCTEVACQPTPVKPPVPAAPPKPPVAVAKLASEPANPRPDAWRDSWGKVEPWKAPAQANNGKVPEPPGKRAAPVTMDPPKQPSPLKAPDLYRDLALQARPRNSKMPNDTQPLAASNHKNGLFSTPPAQPNPAHRPIETRVATAPPPPPPMSAPQTSMPPAPAPMPAPQAPMTNAQAHMPTPNVSPPAQRAGRVIQLPANEANAFWTPAEPANSSQQGKVNAFDRVEAERPPNVLPPVAGALPMPPRGPALVLPRPPLPPMPPPMPPSPDTGVPEAMGNAFTLAGTRRPIPADFGGTPQEPNGFGDAVPQMRGQGSPPRAYGMGTYGYPRPPMPVNPLMSVPYQPAAAQLPVAVAPAPGVPQLLATLKESLYPSQREGAAEQLSELDWRIQPKVVEGLMTAAREDPAATVRATCVRALAHMKVNTSEAAALVQSLKGDRDPRVRQEAEEALATLGISAGPAEPAIQQASHRR